jgi:hypothetical protein
MDIAMAWHNGSDGTGQKATQTAACAVNADAVIQQASVFSNQFFRITRRSTWVKHHA